MILSMMIFVCLFLLPGILVIVFAKKMIESNAKTYPRVYTPLMKRFSLMLVYFVGLGIILIGLFGLVLPLFGIEITW